MPNSGYADSGAYLTPPGLASRRRLFDAMLQQGIDPSPVQHWTQGLARLTQAMVGGYGGYRADQDEREGLARLGRAVVGPDASDVTTPWRTETRPEPAAAAPARPSPTVAPATPDDFTSWVQGREGFNARAYPDFRQTSIGYGTRARPGETSITQADAATRLQEEIGQARTMVRAFAPSLSQGQENALTDLTYNAGPNWMQSGLGQAVRTGNWAEAQRLFTQYVNAGGRPQAGLEARRQAAAPWLAPQAGAAAMPPPMRLGGPQPANDPLIPAQEPLSAADAAAAAPPTLDTPGALASLGARGDAFAGDWSGQPRQQPGPAGLGSMDWMLPPEMRGAGRVPNLDRFLPEEMRGPRPPAPPAAPAPSVPGALQQVPGVNVGAPFEMPPGMLPPALTPGGAGAGQPPPAQGPAAPAQPMPATDMIRRLLTSRDPQAIRFGLQLYAATAGRGHDYDFHASEGSLYRVNKRTGQADLVAGNGQGKPPTGFRWAGNGQLEPIPGGPGEHIAGEQAGRLASMQTARGHFSEARQYLVNQMGLGAAIGHSIPLAGAALAPQYDAARRTVRLAIEGALRANTGAAAPVHEVDQYMDTFMPRATDPVAIRQQKLTLLSQFMDNIEENITRGRRPAGQQPNAGGRARTYNPQTGELE
jgi:GH24 family phage-related lysozyme (muramidase)